MMCMTLCLVLAQIHEGWCHSSYRGNSQQIRRERVEPSRGQDNGDVLGGRTLGNVCHEAQEVDGPQVVVLHGVPKESGRDCLSVMHIAL